MDTTDLDTNPDHAAEYERTTIAAVFADRDMAHETIRRLHDEGFRETWLGITRLDATTTSYASDIDDTTSGTTRFDEATSETTLVESDNWFMRLFSDSDETLFDALVKRGVPSAQARRVGGLADHSAIVTVNGENDPELAAQIVMQTGGDVITGRVASAEVLGGRFSDRALATSNVVAARSERGEPSAEVGLATDPYAETGTAAERYRNTAPATGRSDANGVVADGSRSAGSAIDAVPGASGQTRAPVTVERGLDDAIDAQPLRGAGAERTGFGDVPDAGAALRPDLTSTNDDASALDPLSVDSRRIDTSGDSAMRDDSFERNRRIQLREERLRIGTDRISRGEATVGKEIVNEKQDISVPLIREQLFIERRPVTGAAAGAAESPAIGDDTEIIRIPLTEERLDVSKVAVVTEEIVIGKQKIEEMGRVVETTRKETLKVHDVDTFADAPRQ